LRTNAKVLTILSLLLLTAVCSWPVSEKNFFAIEEFRENLLLWLAPVYAVCLLLSIIAFKVRISIVKTDGMILLFFLSGIWSEFNNNGDTGTIFKTGVFTLLYFSMRVTFSRNRQIGIHSGKYVCLFVLVNFMIHLFYGYGQLLGITKTSSSLFFVNGAFDDPGIYSIFLSVCYLFLLFYVTATFRRPIWGIVLLNALTVPFLFYLYSRTTLLMLVIGWIAYTWYFHREPIKRMIRNLRIRRLIAGIVCLLLALASGLLYYSKKDSADGRILIWKVSAEMIVQRPALGAGHGAFARDYNLAQASYFIQHAAQEKTDGYLAGFTRVAFNDFLQLIYEQGVAGLICFLLILFCIRNPILFLFTKNASRDEPVAVLQLCASVCFVLLLLSMFTSYPMEILSLKIIFYVLISILAAYTDGQIVSGKGMQSALYGVWIILLPVLITGCVKYAVERTRLYPSITTDASAARTETGVLRMYGSNEFFIYNKGDKLVQNVAPEPGIKYLEEAKSYSSHFSLYLNIGMLYQVKGDMVNAEKNLLVAHHMIPHMVTPKFLLAQLYYSTGQQRKWFDMANRVINDREKIPSEKIDAMRMEIRTMLREK
jgi:O-antigen polymerase